jgi:hypothetical protein
MNANILIFAAVAWLLGCTEGRDPSVDSHVGFESKICAAFDKQPQSDELVVSLLRELVASNGGELLDERPNFYVRIRSIDYYIIYHFNYPYFGSLLQTYWSEDRSGAVLDDQVRQVLIELPGWRDCSESHHSSITRF